MTAIMMNGWPDRLVTLADWEQFPEDESHRVECSEGILIVTPRPIFLHQRAVTRLTTSLEDQLPASLSAVADFEMLITDDPLTIRVPDVAVTSTAAGDTNPARLHASEILLAVEILSPGSRRTDRVTKFSEYAEAGIPDYWILDLETPSLTCYQLSDVGTYQPNGEFSSVAEVTTGVGVLSVDLARLTRR